MAFLVVYQSGWVRLRCITYHFEFCYHDHQWILPVCELHTNIILWNILFCVELLLLNITFMRFIHTVACIGNTFLFCCSVVYIVWIYPQFISPFSSWWSILTALNNAAVNKSFVCIECISIMLYAGMISFGIWHTYVLFKEILPNCCLEWLHHTFLPKICVILYLCQLFILSVLLILAIF